MLNIRQNKICWSFFVTKNVFIRITIADLSTSQYVSSQFSDENENPITSVLQNVNQNWVNQPITFKCIGVSNLNGVNTRHRLTIEYEDYIYGSADVVGLMCLKVFVNGDNEKYESLKSYAMRLGSAFQKVNFLRDLKMIMKFWIVLIFQE